MDEKLEKELYKKYPKLFRQKDLSMQETCMNWGIETGTGWYWIIDQLCSCIQDYIDANNKPQAEFVQVKEKFGQLRVYIDNADEYIRGMISLAETMSYVTCESCGVTTGIIHTSGYIKTLCKSCSMEKG